MVLLSLLARQPAGGTPSRAGTIPPWPTPGRAWLSAQVALPRSFQWCTLPAVTAQPPDPRAQRVARLLETLVRVQGISLRNLERQLGASVGTARRIFNGVITLKLSHILDILEVLDIPPATFFRIAFEDTDAQVLGESQTLLIQAQSIRAQRETQPVPDASFLRLVEASLQQLGVIPPTPRRSKKKACR